MSTTPRKEFFCNKGNDYFGDIFGCAIQYFASEWEESAEIEFGNLWFGFDDVEEFDWTDFDLILLEAECLMEICKEMQNTIRVNIDGMRFEVQPSENLETLEGHIRAQLATPIVKDNENFVEHVINKIFNV